MSHLDERGWWEKFAILVNETKIAAEPNGEIGRWDRVTRRTVAFFTTSKSATCYSLGVYQEAVGIRKYHSHLLDEIPRPGSHLCVCGSHCATANQQLLAKPSRKRKPLTHLPNADLQQKQIKIYAKLGNGRKWLTLYAFELLSLRTRWVLI